ncbi:dihydrodipicolinate synthase family protein [uncultured Draconibacterium sp.]|uniref:dihydrodipicolinate synthase family protein n=1 Tax=uncultured Draconibacterium sp. TaxID=1573823 RepID=UPI0025D9A70E|nr:dihydrodipicolinate synthase family protein [uncultured Draconibacterium sp.]
MTDLKKFGGVVVPMVSPFTSDYQVDEAAVKRIVNLFIENKVQPLVLGTTGEVASMSAGQKNTLLKTAVSEINGKVPVVAGLCGNALATLIDEGKRYADLGVDALVALSPNYYPANDKQALNWFAQLADKLPVPMFLYNIPATTHHVISLDVIERLSHHDNIIGIKDSQPDLNRMEESLRRWGNREDFLFLVGCAANSCAGLEMGADGIVPSLGNLFPGLYKALFVAAMQGDFEEAKHFQKITNELSAYNQKGRTVTEAIPALKALMSIKGLCGLDVLPPMMRMDAREEQSYLEEMKEKLTERAY